MFFCAGISPENINLENLNLESIHLSNIDIGVINTVFIIAAVILLSGFIKGCRMGFAAEITSLISLLVSVTALVVLIRMVREYTDKDIVSVIIGIISLIVLILVYKIVSFILEALKLLSKIPVIKWGDALAGGAVGIVEGVVVIWILFTLVTMFHFGSINTFIMQDIAENTVLAFLFRHNYIAYFAAGIL